MQISAVYSLSLSYFWKFAFPREERDNWDLQNENMEALADLLPFKKESIWREREVSGLVSNHHFFFLLRGGQGERMHMQSWDPGVLSWCIYFHFFHMLPFFDSWPCILMNLKLKYPLFSLMWFEKEKNPTHQTSFLENIYTFAMNCYLNTKI